MEKTAFNAIQMMSFAMHILAIKSTFFIYVRKCTKYLDGTWSLLIPNDFRLFDPYNVIYNIPVLLKTGFVVQGHN